MRKHKSDLPPVVITSAESLREVIMGKAVLIMSRAALARSATLACANSSAGEFYVAREPTFKFNSVFYLNKRMSPQRQEAINKR